MNTVSDQVLQRLQGFDVRPETFDYRLQSSPIIVKIIPPKEENLYDVMTGALGVTGVMILIAVIAAGVFGAVLYWVRSRQA